MQRPVALLAVLASLHCSSAIDPLQDPDAGAALPSAPVTPPADTTPAPPAPTAMGVELPRRVPVVPAGLDARPCTHVVSTNGGLQPALNAARGGDVLCLDGTYRGSFVVPARPDTGWVVIRSRVLPALERIRPSTATGLARLESAGVASTLTFATRAARTLVVGLEVTTDPARPDGPVALVQVGQLQETDAANLPTDIALDRVWVHGHASQQVRRAIAANGAAFTMVRSWCEEIHGTNVDSQCIASWGGAGPMLVEDNYLSAASENLVFGGGDPRVPGLVASDITVRRNHLHKPPSWFGMRWNVKNLVESKASHRVLIEENVLEGQWFDAAPGHAALVLKSTSQDGTCPRCDTSDWTVRRNLFRHIGTWLSIAGRADQGKLNNGGESVAGRTDSTNRRIAIVDNWVDSVAVEPYTNQNRPNILFVAENYQVTLRGNVVEGAGPTLASSVLFDISGAIKVPVVDLVMEDNVLPRGQYGMFASATAEGLPSWLAGAQGQSAWRGNAMLGATAAAYPPGTTWSDALPALGTSHPARAAFEALLQGVVVPR